MDPYAGNILNPATLHKYVYAGNNPVNRIDPTGQADEEEEVSIFQSVARFFRRPIVQAVVGIEGTACTIYGIRALSGHQGAPADLELAYKINDYFCAVAVGLAGVGVTFGNPPFSGK